MLALLRSLYHNRHLKKRKEIDVYKRQVEELFEARKPKGRAISAEFGGKAEIRDTKKKREVVITNEETIKKLNHCFFK